VPLVQSGATVQTPTNEISKLTAATANTFTANQIIEVTDNVNAALRVTQLGTGNALLIEDSTNPDSTPVVVTAAGDVGIGVVPSTPLHVYRNNTGTGAQIQVEQDGTGHGTLGFLSTGAYAWLLGIDTADLGFKIAASGTGLTTSTRLTIDTSGNILNVGPGGLGYGTGSGGSVTQLTSKGTSVTLNKTNGAITTNNSALAGGGTATFTVTNSTMAASDTVILNVTNGNYSGRVYNNAAGSFIVALKNETGGSLTDAVQINFAIIKAVTS
jgi:hypothetical protein